MQFCVALSDAHACSSMYAYSYKGILSKSIPLAACALRNRVVAYVIAIHKNYSVCVIYTHVNDVTWPSIWCSIGDQFRKLKASVK